MTKYRNKLLVGMMLSCLILAFLLPSDMVMSEGKEINNHHRVKGLDYDFMWEVTEHLANATHEAYKGNEIRKGRAFGTPGADWSAHYLNDTIFNKTLDIPSQLISLCPLNQRYFLDKYNLTKNYSKWHYTWKVETIDYQLIINHPDYEKELNLPAKVPKNETFVFPSAINPTYNYTFNKTKVKPILLPITNIIPILFGGEWFDKPYMVLVGIKKSQNIWGPIGNQIYVLSHIFYRMDPNCKGYILYDAYDDTHAMGHTTRDWLGYTWPNPNVPQDVPALPVFSVNKTIGDFLLKHYKEDECTISGYINQTYNKSVKAYNVEGWIQPDNKKNCNKTVIISNRYDGWWGETPCDSGAGAGIVMGIAKYFMDYNITPKYNVTFLFTTGEEYGMRGAWHYNHSHPEEMYTFIHWIGIDQLAFPTGKYLTIGATVPENYSNPTELSNYKIVQEIARRSNYDKIMKDRKYKLNFTKDGGGTDLVAFKNRCPAIVIHKSQGKKAIQRYHRAGRNFKEGDSLKNIDRNDLDIAFEIAWNITKYFTVNPDSWVDEENITCKTFDSDDVFDDKNDSVELSIPMMSVLPSDGITILGQLRNENRCLNKTFNFTITSTLINKNITLTVPSNWEEGAYNLTIYLFNSTGSVNYFVNKTWFNPEESWCTIVHLHPYKAFPWWIIIAIIVIGICVSIIMYHRWSRKRKTK